MLSKLRHNAPLETCLQVYYAIFYSHVTYGCSIWGLSKGENLKKIEVLQKKCLWIMTFSDFNSHTNSLFTDLKLLMIQDIVKSQQLKLVYEFFDKVLPDDLQTLFDHTRDIHNFELNSFHKNLLHIPSIKTATYGNKSIKFLCAELWNSTFRYGIAIDKDIRKNVTFNDIRNLPHFKLILKKHFLYIYSLN